MPEDQRNCGCAPTNNDGCCGGLGNIFGRNNNDNCCGGNSEILFFIIVFLLLFTNFGCCGR